MPAAAARGERVAALDLARFVMALLVIGAHGRLFADLSYPLYFATFVGGWARLIMPIFLMISGYFFAVQVRRGVGRWARHVLALHLVWSTVYIGVWMPWGTFSLEKAVFWYVFGAGHLWFMPALLGGGLMLYALRGWSTRGLLMLAGGLYALGGALQYGMDLTVDFDTVAHHNALYALPRNFLFFGFPFVALGHVMAREGVLDAVQGLLRWRIVAVVVALVVLENWVKYVAFPHNAVFEVCLVNFLAGPLVFAWLMTLKLRRAAWWMAPMSAAIYFVHALVLMALAALTGLAATPLTLLAMPVCVVAGAVIVWLNNRPIPLA
jgi:peptidoglycan/LPS O-acetylase OafA/YrhL